VEYAAIAGKKDCFSLSNKSKKIERFKGDEKYVEKRKKKLSSPYG